MKQKVYRKLIPVNIMNYVNIKNEKSGINKYFYNPTIIKEATFKVTKLHIYRIRLFIRDLLESLDHELSIYDSILDEIVALAIKLLGVKKELKVTLNELTLASLWITLQYRGVSNLNIVRLVEISRKKLKKKVLYKNLLKILSHLRKYNNVLNPKAEIMKIVSNSLLKLMKNSSVKGRLERIKDLDVRERYFLLLKREIISIVSENSNMEFSGKSRITLAAILIYVADKILAKDHGFKPVLSAKILEEIMGVCQFTILRRYKDYRKFY